MSVFAIARNAVIKVCTMQLSFVFSEGKQQVLKRFLRKVEVSESGCWLWRGAINDKKSEFAYGAFSLKGRKMYAHRAAYWLFKGSLRAGKVIMHSPKCESESCVNPEHLSQGLQSTNKTVRWTRRWYGGESCGLE